MRPSQQSMTQIVQMVQADPFPDMPTIEDQQVQDQYEALQQLSNGNQFEQELLRAIYNQNIDSLGDLKLHLRELNFLDEFTLLEIDQLISPLILATAVGSVEIVKQLLTNEFININLESQPSELTPLKVACSHGFFEIAEILVNHGADVNKRNTKGQLNSMNYLFSIFVKKGSVPLFYCFHRLEEEKNYFENKYLCFKLAEMLIQKGADIDAIVCQKKNYTLLLMFCAVKEELNPQDLQLNLDVIQFLVQNGADRTRTTTKGKNCRVLCSKHPAREEVFKIINQVPDYSDNRFNLKKISKPQIINQKQVIKMEGTKQGQTQCCSILSQSRNIQPDNKAWWDIF